MWTDCTCQFVVDSSGKKIGLRLIYSGGPLPRMCCEGHLTIPAAKALAINLRNAIEWAETGVNPEEGTE